MPSTRFHRAKMRRAEREPLTAHGRINLVPLVDILTSIVFFSLLTYTGAVMANLTSFDLALPPVVVTADQARANGAQPDTTALILAVKIWDGNLRVEHSGRGQPFLETIPGTSNAALDQLQALLSQIKQQYPDNNAVLIVPDDATPYDQVVHVMERAKLANYGEISLANRERATRVASAAPGGY